ncbi:hypothetical protein [Streptomyces iranensis]|uniref:hypothetical protein n=1 Tax=Streptomyces iranensis TaxID=576784 RepID=UPI0039B750CA
MHHHRVRRLFIWVAGAALLGAGALTVFPDTEGHAEAAAGAGAEAKAAAAKAAAAKAPARAGARTPFATVEAESGTLGGGAKVHAIKPGDPAPTKATPETEASGYAYAELDRTGQSVAVVNKTGKQANTLVVRASVPDAPHGGDIAASLNLYVDGKYRQAITISSRQAWNYRHAGTNADDPNAGGAAYRFYNEFPVWVEGAPIPAGSTVTLKKEAANTAAYYDVDSVDLENVGNARTRPEGSLSVVDHGADPTSGKDSTIAIQKTVDTAREQGKKVDRPPGPPGAGHLLHAQRQRRGRRVPHGLRSPPAHARRHSEVTARPVLDPHRARPRGRGPRSDPPGHDCKSIYCPRAHEGTRAAGRPSPAPIGVRDQFTRETPTSSRKKTSFPAVNSSTQSTPFVLTRRNPMHFLTPGAR